MMTRFSHRKSSLRWYLALFVSLIILFFTTLLLLVPSSFYKNSFLEQAQNYCQNMIIQTSTGVHTALKQLDDTTDELLADPAFIDLMNPALNEADRIYQYQNIVQEYFPSTSLLRHYIKGIDFYIKDSGSHLHYGTNSVELDSPFSSAYYQTAMSVPIILTWNNTLNGKDLVLSRIVYDFETYELKGLMIISLSSNFLRDKFNTYNTMEVDNFYIVNGDGYIMCADDTSLIGTLYPNYDTAFTEKIGTIDSSKQISVYCQSSATTYDTQYWSWYIIMNINKDILLKDFYTIMKTTSALAGVIILVGVLISLEVSKYISRPIQNLAEKMSSIQDENLDTHIEGDTPFLEISQMNQGFNDMVQRLNTLINTVYRTELAKKEAQFNALQAQINPHFLFNTMQLISWKANEYEAYPVCEMVQSLCYMLETTLSYRGEQTFSLQEEILYLKHYANILHYKYMDKITLNFQVPEELLQCQIPILTFQPFIENSVIHGLEPLQKGGTVTLTARHEGNNLIASISDNGVGIRPDVLRMLRQNIPIERRHNESSYHMALHNIQTRIKLLYGEEYGYTIESTLYEGTSITLVIPYQTDSYQTNAGQPDSGKTNTAQTNSYQLNSCTTNEGDLTK